MSELEVMGRLAERAFRRYYGEVYRFLLRRTADAAEAEELTQRVFADAAAAERQLEQDRRPVLPWLLAVAHRRWVDERRRGYREQRALDATGGQRISRPDDEATAALRRALAQLPVDQRDVVARRLWRGDSFREIATQLSVSEGAVKMRFRRGIESLQRSLREEGYEP